jgi:hypothetical protein
LYELRNNDNEASPLPSEEPIDHVMQKIKKKYDSDQENWSVLGNSDKDGNREMFISQQPNTYWLKMKQINPYSHMALGTELTNIDDEINKNIGTSGKKINSQQELMQLFGMVTPSKKDVIYTAGIERYSPPASNELKNKVEEKEPDADKNFRKALRQKWEKEYFDREGIYM